MKYEFPADLYTSETMPNGEIDRCSSLTKRGKGPRCKNPVFAGGQRFIGTTRVVGYVDGHEAHEWVVVMTQEEYDEMLLGLCYVHRT